MTLQMLRTSERTSYKRCPWMWHHEWVQGLREINPKPNAADFGSGLHFALGCYYIPGKKRGPNPVKTWREWMDGHHGQYVRIDDLSDPEHDGQAKFADALELGVEMLTCYLDTYGRDKSWTMIAPEQRFSIRIPHPDNPKRAVVNYVGTLDGLYRDEDDGTINILENKSTNRNLARYMADISWTEQAGGYPAVATQISRKQGLIGPRESVRGMTYNLLRRAKQDDRPINADGMRCNQPKKDHYISYIVGNDKNITNDQADKLKKLTLENLDDLATVLQQAKNLPHGVFGEVSARQPGDYFMRETFQKTARERAASITRIGEEALHMRAVRGGRLPILKNPTMDCGWQCRFFQLCQIDENGDDYDYFKETAYEVVDPYADHREGAQNSKVS